MSHIVEDGEPDPAWHGVRSAYPDDRSVAELFARRAGRTPEAVAVVSAAGRLTYAELHAWSDRLATALRAAGVRPGEPVGLLGERCLEAPVGMLGILLAGAVYVPLDRSDPVARLRTMIDQLTIRHIVSLPGAAGVLDGVTSTAVADVRTGPRAVPEAGATVGGGDPAYIMFTSGSTGVPKAVVIPHRAIARLVLHTNFIDVTAGDRLGNTGHPTFDASVFEIWGALLNGARAVVVDPDTLLDPARLEDLFRAEGVTVAWLSAGVFHHCARTRPAMFGQLRCLIAGGDVLNPALVRQVLDAGPPGRLLNGYGPTENTTFSTTYEIGSVPPGTERIPIGRPIANTTCHILREDGSPASVGETGELWVGGDGVALGYANDPELTADRFVPDPGGYRPGARRYRTGDLVRWLPDGNIDFLGRGDRMVKVRDFRVELDEIEAVLSRAPGTGDVAVITVGDSAATRTIVACFVADRDTAAKVPVSAADLRAFLADRLPHFMLPARVLRLDEFPLSGTGKVDRAALASLAAQPAARAPGPLARRPTTAAQIGLATLWAELLDTDDIGLDDSFFALGGNSLVAARVFTRLQTMFGIAPTQSRFLTARLLADPSLAACAAAVEEARAGTRRPPDTVLDFDRECALDVPIAAGTPADGPVDDILLTGATGFIGGYLLRRLLTVTGARIHCLVRATDARHARDRLLATQAHYQLGDLPEDRVVAVAGDLSLPLLGLADDLFDGYARSADLILHAGAYVNFTYPYHWLAGVTVGGTREVIRLAGRYRGIPVHFVSTLAVLAGFGAAGVRAVTEDTPLAYPDHLHLGYTEAKWVAESLLRKASMAGLPIAVYRPYEVSGDLRHGAWNLENATCAMFRLMIDAGVAPDIDLPLDLVPVDVLAAQITELALRRPRHGMTYHLTNPRPATLNDMTDRLRGHGYPIRAVPLDEWVARAVSFVSSHPEHPFTPFIPLWVDRSPANGLVVKQMYLASRFPRFTRTNMEEALGPDTPRMPPVDADLLDHYIRFFQRSGYFPPARPAASRPEP